RLEGRHSGFKDMRVVPWLSKLRNFLEDMSESSGKRQVPDCGNPCRVGLPAHTGFSLGAARNPTVAKPPILAVSRRARERSLRKKSAARLNGSHGRKAAVDGASGR